MISNLLWSWAFVMDGHNSMKLSQPLRYDQTLLSVLQVCHHKVTEVMGQCILVEVARHAVWLYTPGPRSAVMCRFMHGSSPCH